jgi:hypothetical protein
MAACTYRLGRFDERRDAGQLSSACHLGSTGPPATAPFLPSRHANEPGHCPPRVAQQSQGEATSGQACSLRQSVEHVERGRDTRSTHLAICIGSPPAWLMLGVRAPYSTSPWSPLSTSTSLNARHRPPVPCSLVPLCSLTRGEGGERRHGGGCRPSPLAPAPPSPRSARRSCPYTARARATSPRFVCRGAMPSMSLLSATT